MDNARRYEMVFLLTCHYSYEMNIIKGLLETNGIVTYISTKGVGHNVGELYGIPIQYDIFVRDKDLADARKLTDG